MSNKTSVWERTSVQNLLRNRNSGKYYGRWIVSGKQKWVSLSTDVFTVAKLRLGDEGAKIERLRGSRTAVESGAATVGDLIRVYEERARANTELKASSITARLVALKKLLKTWPKISALKPGQITPAAVGEWATKFKAEGTNFLPHGATHSIKGNSATSVNGAIDSLRRIMDIGIERGAIHTNPVNVKPAEGRLKKKVVPKKLSLPSFANVQKIFSAIENNGSVGGWGPETADFCRFLAFTGCRVGEMRTITWGSIDKKRRQLHVRGEKTQTSNRMLPLFADLETLLGKIEKRRKNAGIYGDSPTIMLGPEDNVFRISECQKSIDRACATVGVPRLTHHDFRHLFATRCIESGVDIQTISRWLGHADGGALAMKTYGHLREEHSQAQATRVSFGGAG